MRLRLFTLILVPSLALMVLGFITYHDRQQELGDAAAASDSAALAFQIAELDRALGAEALEGTRYFEGEVSWPQLILGAFAETDQHLSRLNSQGVDRIYGEEVASALRDISKTVGYRSDIRDGLISPLQLVDRYSHLRRILLDALAVEVGSVTTSDSSQSVLVLTALAEARSAHLNERIAIDLAIEYDSWAPGQHSAAISAMATHDSHLRFANNNGFLKFGEIAITDDLATIRAQVRVDSQPPQITADNWQRVSDDWSQILEQQIEASVTHATTQLTATEDSATNDRNATVGLIVATLMVALVVTLIVAMRIVGRVQAIAGKAAMLATGDSWSLASASSVVGGKDEIADLAEAFDNMALQISVREEALAIESAALESIANGAPIDTILESLEPLLGSDASGRRSYRFTRSAPTSDSEPINEMTEDYTPIWVAPVGEVHPLSAPYNTQARSAIGLATLAQRRADDTAVLHHRATKDPLTGLLNRRAILEDVGRWLAMATDTGQPYPALIYADLDGFKRINDTFGHAAGDCVLLKSSARMTDMISELGGEVGRFGGDEFLLVVPGVTSDDHVREISQMVVESLSAPVDIGQNIVRVGVSIGAVVGRPETSVADLLSDADLALYAAKAAGRGQMVISDEEFRGQAQEMAELKADVIAALENEEFIPWFQPIWSDNGTTIAAFEALVRWKSPSGRTVGPHRFIPILEQQKLIGALDALMLRKVCAILAEWKAEGRAVVPMHMNVSPSRIEHSHFVAETKAAIEETGVEPELIIIEVTESDLMSDILQNGRRLQELRDIGIAIATDDFGKGYSSLSYLRDLPVDILKIDRQFITELDKSPTNIAIVSAIIGLARALGMAVVAEGVEREEERAVLAEHGCHFLQGFLLGRPAPKKETEALLGRKSSAISNEMLERLPVQPPDSDLALLESHFESLRDHLAEGDRRLLGDTL